MDLIFFSETVQCTRRAQEINLVKKGWAIKKKIVFSKEALAHHLFYSNTRGANKPLVQVGKQELGNENDSLYTWRPLTKIEENI